MKFGIVVALFLLTFNVVSALQTNVICADKQCEEAREKLLIGVHQQQPTNSFEQIKFYLFHRGNNSRSEGLTIFDSHNIKKIFIGFSPWRETKIIIHGWMNDVDSPVNKYITAAYLLKTKHNLVVVDWSGAGSKLPVYPLAKWMTQLVGEAVEYFIDILCSTYHLNTKHIHIIGHSLGAHIAGIVGHNTNSGLIGRITGLDPASPLYGTDNTESRLSNESASFVDVIHTCGKFLGVSYQMGHADFFPNNGFWSQPGCGADLEGICSHGRAYLYFAESITNPSGFQSRRCSSWTEYDSHKCDNETEIVMGESVLKTARGSYFLRTNSKQPFSIEES